MFILYTADEKLLNEQSYSCHICRNNVKDLTHLHKARDDCHLSGYFCPALCSNINLTHSKQKCDLFMFFSWSD